MPDLAMLRPLIGAVRQWLSRWLSRGLAPATFSATWILLALATAGAIAATATYLPLHSSRSAVAPQRPAPDSPLRARSFAERWYDGWTQLTGRVAAPVPRLRNDNWLWTDATPSPYATRFASIDPRLSGGAAVTPLPMARPDGIPRQVAVPAAPQPSEQRLAALPPQQPQVQPEPSEPGILDKLFGDPDRAAKAVLASYPKTVLYDITRRAVYLPDGTKLEAHSGFGEWMDDPDSVHRKNVGVTPPNVYAVSFREKPFHGVRALRMKPVGEGKMYGRDGILAHSYLLGEAGASNGCVSIREYEKFLKAYEDGQFNQIIVLRSVDEPVPRLLASAQ